MKDKFENYKYPRITIRLDKETNNIIEYWYNKKLPNCNNKSKLIKEMIKFFDVYFKSV